MVLETGYISVASSELYAMDGLDTEWVRVVLVEGQEWKGIIHPDFRSLLLRNSKSVRRRLVTI